MSLNPEEAWERVRFWLDDWFGEMVLRPKMFGQGRELEHTVLNMISIEMEGYNVRPPLNFLKGVAGMYFAWLRQHGISPGACVSAFEHAWSPRQPPTEAQAYEILIGFVHHTRSSYLPVGQNSTPTLLARVLPDPPIP